MGAGSELHIEGVSRALTLRVTTRNSRDASVDVARNRTRTSEHLSTEGIGVTMGHVGMPASRSLGSRDLEGGFIANDAVG